MTEIYRYYIVDVAQLETGELLRKHRSRILHSRPSRWSVFLAGVLRLNPDLAFVRLPDEVMQRFDAGTVAAMRVDEHYIKVNAHIGLIEPWTFWTLCKFCIEGLQYGTFQRIWHWKW